MGSYQDLWARIKLARRYSRRAGSGQGWDEAEGIRIEGPDKEIRRTFDNVRDGNRYSVRRNNQFIRMKDRGIEWL